MIPALVIVTLAATGIVATPTTSPDNCPEGEVVTTAGCVVPPVVVGKREFQYPEEARKQDIAAELMYSLIVSVEGEPQEITLLSCSAPGHGFEESTLRTIEAWRWTPATRREDPIAFRVSVRASFNTAGSRKKTSSSKSK